MKNIMTTIVFILTTFIVGCTSVSVKKVENESDCGIRYSLPKPHLLVTPQLDGSLEVDVVMLPNPDETYTVCSWSVFATHDLTLKTENGILTKADWTGDSSAVAADAAKASGGIVASYQNALIKAASDAATTTDDTQGTPASAQGKKREVTKPDRGKVWGPVLFDIVDTGDTVALRAMRSSSRNQQREYNVYRYNVAGTQSGGSGLEFTPKSLGDIKKGSKHTITLENELDFDSVKATTKFEDSQGSVTGGPKAKKGSSKVVDIEIPSNHDSGQFEMHLLFLKDAKPVGSIKVPYRVEP